MALCETGETRRAWTASGAPDRGLPGDDPVGEPGPTPEPGPAGPRTPYPVDDPAVVDPERPGSQPDVNPGRPLDPGTRF